MTTQTVDADGGTVSYDISTCQICQGEQMVEDTVLVTIGQVRDRVSVDEYAVKGGKLTPPRQRICTDCVDYDRMCDTVVVTREREVEHGTVEYESGKCLYCDEYRPMENMNECLVGGEVDRVDDWCEKVVIHKAEDAVQRHICEECFSHSRLKGLIKNRKEALFMAAWIVLAIVLSVVVATHP